MTEHAPVCDHPLFNYQPAWALAGSGEHTPVEVGYVTHTTDLPSMPEVLWAVVSDPQTWAEWLTAHERWVTNPAGGFAPGRRMTAQIGLLGITNAVEWTVEAVIAPASLVLTGTAPGLKTHMTITVVATEGGSRLTLTCEFAGAQLNDAVIAALEEAGSDQLEISAARLEELAARLTEFAATVPPARPALRLVHSAPDAPDDRPRVGRTAGSAQLRMVR